MDTWNKDREKEQATEQNNGDRAPEDMVEYEFWDDTDSQKGGDPVRGLWDFQEIEHWNGESDDDYSSSDDKEEEEESSDSNCNLSGEEEGQVKRHFSVR